MTCVQYAFPVFVALVGVFIFGAALGAAAREMRHRKKLGE